MRSSSIGAARCSRATRSRSRTRDSIPDARNNQYGFSIGGPIMQNKSFFFGDYQGTRSAQGGSVLLTVPTAAARAGDLGDYG